MLKEEIPFNDKVSIDARTYFKLRLKAGLLDEYDIDSFFNQLEQYLTHLGKDNSEENK
jgi:hypothetical protein